jgi:hypothetical protein
MDIYNTLNEEYIRNSFQEIKDSDLYFINLHYLSRYISIITKFKNRDLLKKENPGFHRHHIIPKCLSGTNEKINLVTLSPREHYIIHHLLWKAFPQTNLTTAFKGMVHGFNYGSHRITSKVYERLCLDYYPINRENLLGNTHASGKRTPEQRQRMSESQKGIKHSDESKKKMSESQRNKPPVTEETKLKISLANKGRVRDPLLNQMQSERMKGNTYVRGLKFSDESKERMSESAKNRQPMSEETKQKMSESQKGRKHSDETRKKMSETQSNRHPVTEETKLKMSESAKLRRLEPTIWVCSSFEKKLIKEELLEEYLSKGYIRGMKYNNNICNIL